jgi:putative endopeptidase
MKIFKTIILCSTILLFNSCQNFESENEKIPGIILENMDTSVDPKDDFYNYVNGNWMKTNTIPDDESRWGGFGVLRKTTRQDVLEIIKTAQIKDNYKEGSDQKKALLIFETKLDTISRNKAGIKPIKHLLDAIEGIKNINDLQTVYATVTGVSAPFAGIGANPDLNDSSVNTAWVFPGGLGLQRDYYLDQDEKTKDIRKDYLKHVSKMFQFIGYNLTNADNAAILILDLETKLAEPRLDKVQSRDIRNFNNPMTIDELESLTPSMNWNKLVLDLGIKKSLDQVLVMQPKYMKELNNVLETTSII